jgi:RNA polymerase sigma factor (sigma-70 family)
MAPSGQATTDAHGSPDVKWFVDHVHPHDQQLKSYLRGSFPAVRELDDVVQESYLRILQRKAVTPIRCAKAFLFETARNIAVDLLRRRTASPVDADPDWERLPVQDAAPSAEESLTRAEKAKLLAESIHALPPRCREIFVLCRLHGLPQKEVAARLGLSVRTVEVQVQAGLARCESYLKKLGVEEEFRR